MGEADQSSAFPAATNDFLEAALIPEDWGGDGRGRMNLSGRRTAIAFGNSEAPASEYVPRQYQLFDSHRVPEQAWQIQGIPEQPAICRMLSWNDHGASTAKVLLPAQFEIPAGRFTADLEIFVLSGAIQVGAWKLSKHCYSFIPAGVRVGDWKVLNGESAEVLWMENGRLQYQDLPNHPEARLGEYIPVLDSKLLPWGKTDTAQFIAANKKWLRKAANGGGVWLLALLPHYDGKQMMIQSYNEEAYGLAGWCDIGDYRFAKNHFCYSPSFSTLPRHISEDGGLFFVRVDRDLSQAGTVLSYGHSG
ncbi:DUF4437 domain-containing protein [Cyanobacteria bacterium FACHB-DQ100]|uniref:DUF4437 domain-containing protein n=1 Tax=unclassified Leptolyngbya TaxID=2650499 RepID=UPI0016802308|nr:DUF4437 domain-containing protein [Leptolyngbya sp. FACHB-17]MBD1824433.1 DUF4437 domain-containing protein [Cyanobacteria bacterium FACHB-DQ100]MBD2080986.1 DUF4437 domain-containing protein [Leptolyngbya sp. FACHB-17]